MTRLEGFGIGVDLGRGWEGEVRPADATARDTNAKEGGGVRPARSVLHLANFALPRRRDDLGGGVVEGMRLRHAFVAVVEFDPEAAGEALFAHRRPRRLRPDDFAPQKLQRALPGQSGCQLFFSESGRAFSLYVVLGSHHLRGVTVPGVNDVLGTLAVDPA